MSTSFTLMEESDAQSTTNPEPNSNSGNGNAPAAEAVGGADPTNGAAEPESEMKEGDGNEPGASDGTGASEEKRLEDVEIERRLLHAAESMIFAADEPVPAHRIAEVFAEVTGREPPDTTTFDAHV